MAPLYEFLCLDGHSEDVYIKTWADKGAQTIICKECGHSMGEIITPSKPLLYFEEGRGRWINNLGKDPILVKSHAEHRELMKKRGVELAGTKPGMKGSWI